MIKAKEEEKREKAELKQARFDARNATKLKAQKKKDDAEAAAKAAAEAASLARTSSKKAKEIALCGEGSDRPISIEPVSIDVCVHVYAHVYGCVCVCVCA